MDTQIEILRDRLHELLNSQEIIVTDETLKISEELDQLIVNHIMQTENQVKNEA